ncbi:cytochrome b/b6 domain-containing protein [Pseudoxanthomonas sp. Root630]|uniref:cytochrome b n=1 Tax=Pseudoxanthomonas sp. Root630 TaxID=1736574 RepID=UPI000A5392C6|nr:cytochrome b/b6 domain-containing protein [Pseudoxanthomonas sp. Root630]
MTPSAVARYPWTIRVLHWLLALLLAVQVVLGLVAEYGAAQLSAMVLPLHFQLGMVILVLTALRLCLRLVLPMPAADPAEPPGLRLARSAAHGLLYLLVLALPVSGHVIWVWMGADRTLFGALKVPALFVPPEDETGRAVAWYVHVYGAWILLGLVGLHILAAVLRQRARRDGFITQRMGFKRLQREERGS